MSVTRRYVRLTTTSAYDTGASNYSNFMTRVAEIWLLDGTDTPISRAGWSVSADSYDANFGEPPANAVDGNNVTVWSTEFDAAQPPQPHTFTIDQGSAVQVYKLRIRNSLATPPPGAVGGYQIHSSPDGSNWTLCGSGTFQTGTPGTGAELDTAELFEVASGLEMMGQASF